MGESDEPAVFLKLKGFARKSKISERSKTCLKEEEAVAMQTYLDPDQLLKYLKIELYHSLDVYGFTREIADIQDSKGKGTADFFKLLSDFYDFLSSIRYSVENANENIDAVYDGLIMRVDNLLLESFQEFERTCEKEPSCTEPGKVDHYEALIIWVIYEKMNAYLSKISEFYRNTTGIGTLMDLKETLDEKFINIDFWKDLFQMRSTRFFKRFVLEPARLNERERRNCGVRLILNKTKRYTGAFWGNIAHTIDAANFFNCLQKQIPDFLDQDEGEPPQFVNPFMATFTILLLTKYHILMHQQGWDPQVPCGFKMLERHFDFDTDRQRNKKLKRTYEVFTFTKFIAKYFAHIFGGIGEETKATAVMIQMLSYMRRASALNLLGDERAFNDYTATEKLSGILKRQYGNNRQGVLSLYKNLVIPYTYWLKGEQYRKEYAFYNAYQYYCNSHIGFESFRESMPFLEKSLKIVRLKLNKAKTFLELGEFRKSLKWLVQGVIQLWDILAMGGEVSTQFKVLVEELDKTRLEPKIIKGDILDGIGALTESLQAVVLELREKGDSRLKDYGTLLSDFFNRISVVLFMLNLPEYNAVSIADYEKSNFEHRQTLLDSLHRNVLAFKWLALSLTLNPRNSLARFNQTLFELGSSQETRQRFDEIRKSYGVHPPPKLQDLIESGQPFSLIYRRIAKATLDALKNTEGESNDREREVARRLLERFLMYTDYFSRKNAEIYKYLIRSPKPKPKDEVYLYIMRRWSSINPALPRPAAFRIRGGGYFLTFKEKGIAVDPGINFIENLYSEGFSISDIDYIIVTHDHIDHTADIDSILSLVYKKNKLIAKSSEKQRVTLVLNESVRQRYGFLLHKPEMFELSTLSVGDKQKVLPDLSDLVISVERAVHEDLSSTNYAIGLILTFFPNDSNRKMTIGITGDTCYWRKVSDNTGKKKVVEVFESEFLKSDILVTHINNTPFRELRACCGITLQDEELKSFLEKLGKMHLDRIKFSLGYRAEEEIDWIFKPPRPRDDELRALEGEHLFFHGVLRTFERALAKSSSSSSRQRLFVISEINEEMGTYRNKVAKFINKLYKDDPKSSTIKCLTGDIGMAVRYKPSSGGGKIQVRCSRCRVNNNYGPDDMFHEPENIKEVCLKWEEEGLFYFCPRHDPESANRKLQDVGFVERVERYDPFRNIDIRIR